jgi:hypothetical protein
MKLKLIPLAVFFISIAIYINFVYPYISQINFADSVILYRNPRFTVADLFSILAITFLSITTYVISPSSKEKIEENPEEIKIEEPSWLIPEYSQNQESEVKNIENRIENEVNTIKASPNVSSNGKEVKLEDILQNIILQASKTPGGITIDSALNYEGELELLGKTFKGDFRVNINTSKAKKFQEKEEPENKEEKKEVSEEEIPIV